MRIAKLFTLATPHRGAILADWPTINEMARQMRPGSEFLRPLNTPPIAAHYRIFPYVWANDNIVGAANAARTNRLVAAAHPVGEPAHRGDA